MIGCKDNEQDDEISLDDRVIPTDATVKALNSLGSTFNFIDIWLHNFRHNYFLTKCVLYSCNS